MTGITGGAGGPTNTFDALGRRNFFTFGPCNGAYLLHEGMSVSGYQPRHPVWRLSDPAGRGRTVPLYLTEPGYTEHDVPINDIFGSTLAVVDTDNSQITNSFSYDPNGMLGTLPGPLGGSSSRGPWGFLYQGLESEPPDAPQLYWEPNGNIYNPDPFQISPNGPIGMGGGSGGGFPHAVAGPGNFGGGPPLALQNEVNESGSQAFALITALGSDTPAWPAAVALQIFAQFFPDLFGNGEPSIPQYDRERTQRGVHPAWEEYTNVASDWIVTQQGNITLAEDDEEEDPSKQPLPAEISGVRGQPPRMPMNDFEQIAMRGVMNGFNQGEASEIMQGKINDPRYKPEEGWRKMQQVFRVTDPPITIHYFENSKTGERAQFHFTSKPAYYDPRYW